MAVTVKGSWTLASATATSPTLAITPSGVATGDILVALCSMFTGGSRPTAISGGGVTWTQVSSSSSGSTVAWIGTGTPASGTLTFTSLSDSSGAAVTVFHIGGTNGTSTSATAGSASGSYTTSALNAGLGQIALGVTFGTPPGSGSTVISAAPTGWTTSTLAVSGTRSAGFGYRIPTVAGTGHTVSNTRSDFNTSFASLLVIGTELPSRSASTSGSGTLSAVALARSVALSGSGAFTVGTRARNAPMTAEGTFSAVPLPTASLSGTGQFNADAQGRNAPTTAYGSFFAQTILPPSRTANKLSGVGTFSATAYPSAQIVPFDRQVLDKLIQYSVNTNAVPINPAEGAPGVPTLSASFNTRDNDPQVLHGSMLTVKDDPIGAWSGRIVKTDTNSRNKVNFALETLIARLNNDLRVFPLMPTTPSVNLGAYAVDYWTQQAALPMDAVDGELVFYQSGYGHPFAYARGLSTVKVYENTTVPDLLTASGRSVKSLTGTSTTKAWDEDQRIPVSVQGTDHMVCAFSGKITSGTATVTWALEEVDKTGHTVAMQATSTGAALLLDGASVATLVCSGELRFTVSLRYLDGSTWAVRFTAQDIGTGALTADSGYFAKTIVGTSNLFLRSVTHAGGSGYRYGTSVSITSLHPVTVPVAQKVLAFGQTPDTLAFVSGFDGNVWDHLNQFCSLHVLDLRFDSGVLGLVPRINTLTVPKLDSFSRSWNTRARWKQVTVKDQQSVTTTDGVLWRADSVHQVARGEVFETTVRTPHSILSLNQPLCVNGITPFPYKNGTGQYVVTGADGYIVSPQWWNDNGGKVEAFLTDKEGEIRIRITAPINDTVRAPYRISEGAGDRPALYVTGVGVLNDPKEVTMDLGDPSAKEGSERVFESPFLTGLNAVYETLARIADSYGAASADAQFECGVGELGLSPVGKMFSDGATVWRVVSAQQEKSKVRGTAVPALTCDLLAQSWPTGTTIDAFAYMHRGQTLDQIAMRPMRSVDESTP